MTTLPEDSRLSSDHGQQSDRIDEAQPHRLPAKSIVFAGGSINLSDLKRKRASASRLSRAWGGIIDVYMLASMLRNGPLFGLLIQVIQCLEQLEAEVAEGPR
jgi:hypothetical protein